MGIFDFFKKKEPKIEEPAPASAPRELRIGKTVVNDALLSDEKFYDPQYQTEILAMALTVHAQTNSMADVRRELNKENLTRMQVEQVCEKLLSFLIQEKELEAMNEQAAADAKLAVEQAMEAETQEREREAEAIRNAIELTETEYGDHNDSFGGLLGYETMQSGVGGEKLINQLISISLNEPPVDQNPLYKVCEADFTSIGGDSTALKIRTVYILEEGDEFILTSFPYLASPNSIPFRTNKITEWKQSANLEAEITGGGRDTFGVGFYATDYAINRDIYNSNTEIDVSISAIALTIDQSDLTEINGTAISPDFSTYMPNKDFETNSHYDFIGKLLDFNPVQLANGISGYLMSVKLINNEEDGNFFTVDMFVNEENMRIKTLEAGMKLTGVIWLQGEIVR